MDQKEEKWQDGSDYVCLPRQQMNMILEMPVITASIGCLAGILLPIYYFCVII